MADLRKITTVGELRKEIECCDDEEPITFVFETVEERVMAPTLKTRHYMVCTGASSTGGGRAIYLWFEEDKR